MAIPIAEELARKQKEISIAEFFERNKHILGFDSLPRALLTGVKEAVDNSLDACEEAGILPDITVEVKKAEKARDEYTIIVEDNGPGITKKQIPNIFGRLLYGSRFHSISQSRGQQGIGISAVVMYAQLTTGRATRVLSKIGEEEPAYIMELMLDTKRNLPEVLSEEVVHWDKSHGTRVEMTLRGRYVRERKQSIYEYIKSTAIVNPHAKITLVEPDGIKTTFDRATDKLPPATREIRPHPEGIELGTLLKMCKATDSYKLTSFLVNDFSRISYRTAREICEEAGLDKNLRPKSLSLEQARALLLAFKKVKIMAPPTDCLSPIGDVLIKKGLKNVLAGSRADFYAPPITREPIVYAGNPVQVEVGMVFGGELEKDSPVEILRFANKVPLLYQQGECACTHAVENLDWRQYGLDQKGGKGIPYGPAVILIHVASTNVPFTSESKEAIADIPEIRKEIENALRVCGRKLRTHLNKIEKRNKIKEKFEIVQKILPLLAEKSASVVGKPVPALDKIITKIMDIVLIEDSIEYEPSAKRHRVKIIITNYTERIRKFRIYSELPDAVVEGISPQPSELRDGRIVWNISSIAPTEKCELVYELRGLDKDDYDETELYVEGIDPIYVIGADPWHGVE